MIHEGKKIYHKRGFDLIKCKNCGFIHLIPFPSKKLLKEFYKKQYYQKKKPDYIKKDIAEEKYWNICYRDRLCTISKQTPYKTILDIGCGSGYFLKVAKKQGWRVQGIEISKTAAEVAIKNKIPVKICDLEKFFKENKKRYAAIHLKNVLEHVPNPDEMLNICNKLLEKNGALCIEVPNDFNLIQKIGIKRVKEKPSWIAIPDHINYFNFKTLRKILERNGFQVYYAETSFPMYLFLLFKKNFIKNPKIGAQIHKKRIKFETILYKMKMNWLKRLFYWFLAKLNLGRTVIFYCKKIK